MDSDFDSDKKNEEVEKGNLFELKVLNWLRKVRPQWEWVHLSGINPLAEFDIVGILDNRRQYIEVRTRKVADFQYLSNGIRMNMTKFDFALRMQLEKIVVNEFLFMVYFDGIGLYVTKVIPENFASCALGRRPTGSSRKELHIVNLVGLTKVKDFVI